MKIIADFSQQPAGIPVPAGFQAAVQAACSFYDLLFTNNVTVTIQFNYGPLQDGSANAAENAPSGDLYEPYTSLTHALDENRNSIDQKTAYDTVINESINPNDSWVTKANYKMPFAQALALGFPVFGPGTSVNGTVTLNNAYDWTFSASDRTVSGELDAIGALEHEISEEMGRLGLDGGSDGAIYTELDLFRYTTNPNGGVELVSAPGPGSFSIDGQTLLKSYNDPTAIVNGKPLNGDLGDWADYGYGQGGVEGDSYGQPAYGVPGLVTQVDLREMNILGWQLPTPTIAQAPGLYAQLYAADPIPNFGLTLADTSTNILQNLNTLDQLALEGAISSISMSLSGGSVALTLPGGISEITLTGSGDAILTGNAMNDTYDIEAQGNHTINPGDLGDCTITSNAGTTTLDYSSLTGELMVDVANGTVDKPGSLWVDTFSGNQLIFDGSSGDNTFKSIGTDNYTFNGQGISNTLDYSADANGVTINLTTDTVTKDRFLPQVSWQDSFSDIQNFVGGGSGNTTFIDGAGTGFSFTGLGGGNTLDCSADVATDGVTINLATDTVTKGIAISFLTASTAWNLDSFSDIQNFVGGGSGHTTFESIGTGDYNFTGKGTANTLDYSADPNGVTIDLTTDTVRKDLFDVYSTESHQPSGPPVGIVLYVDSFSGIQNFVGGGSGNTTFESIGTGDYTFTGQGTANTLDYSADAGPISINLTIDTVLKDYDDAASAENHLPPPPSGPPGGGIDRYVDRAASRILSAAGPVTPPSRASAPTITISPAKARPTRSTIPRIRTASPST